MNGNGSDPHIEAGSMPWPSRDEHEALEARVDADHAIITRVDRRSAAVESKVDALHAYVSSRWFIVKLCIPPLIASAIAYAPRIYAFLQGLF